MQVKITVLEAEIEQSDRTISILHSGLPTGIGGGADSNGVI
jgi:hypothetical protein